MHDFCTAHILNDLVQRIRFQRKLRGGIGWKFGFPGSDMQFLIESGLPRSGLKPKIAVIKSVVGQFGDDVSHAKTHNEVIGSSSKGDGARKYPALLQAKVKQNKQKSTQRSDYGNGLHYQRKTVFLHSRSILSLAPFELLFQLLFT
jgi:hypothetical protein